MKFQCDKPLFHVNSFLKIYGINYKGNIDI